MISTKQYKFHTKINNHPIYKIAAKQLSSHLPNLHPWVEIRRSVWIWLHNWSSCIYIFEKWLLSLDRLFRSRPPTFRLIVRALDLIPKSLDGLLPTWFFSLDTEIRGFYIVTSLIFLYLVSKFCLKLCLEVLLL